MASRLSTVPTLILATWGCGFGCAGGGPKAPGPEVAFAYDKGVPLNPVVQQVRDGDAWTRILLTLAGLHGERIPAALWSPLDPGLHPALILAHGMPGHRTTFQQQAEEYAAAGVVVLSLTAPWGRGRQATDLREPSLFTLPHFDARDREELVRYVRELRRGLDFLETLSDVDPERMAVVGHSYGATSAAIVAGIDQRPVAVVLASVVSGLPDRFTDEEGRPTGLLAQLRSAEAAEEWLELMDPVDATHFLPGATAAILFQLGRGDELAQPNRARKVIRAAPASATVRWYDAGHRLPPIAWADQSRWLGPLLGLPADSSRAPGVAEERQPPSASPPPEALLSPPGFPAPSVERYLRAGTLS